MSEMQMPDPTDREPVLRPAVIVAVVGAVLALAVSLGLDLDGGQQAAVMAVVTAGAPLLAGWLGRRKAWSGASVAERDRR